MNIRESTHSYAENEDGKITHLNCSNAKIHHLEEFLKDIDCSNCKELNLQNNQIRNLYRIDKDGKTVNFLDKLTNLKVLDLSDNQLRDISFLEVLQNLEELDLADNFFMRNYDVLNAITKKATFKNLILTHNKELDLSKKGINDISFIEKIKDWENLRSLKLDGNPFITQMEYFEQIDFPKDKNHLDIIKGYFAEKENKDNYNGTMPVKLMFLGNHAAGKTSYREYINDEEITISDNDKNKSTHVLNISYYPKTANQIEETEAIIYDFGGQDYYHGIYRAFFSENAINAVFWCKDTNKNQEGTDSNNPNQNIRNYRLENWLTQLKYSYSKKDNENWKENNPVLLFQTHADKYFCEDKSFIKDDCKCNYRKTVKFLQDVFTLNDFNVINDFFVAITETEKDNCKNALCYSKAFLNQVITEEQEKEKQENNQSKNENKIKTYHISFLNDIRTQNSKDAQELTTVISKIKKNNNLNDDAIKNFLEKCAKKGLILWYRNNEKIKEKIWLNPQETIKDMHDNIFLKGLANNGKFFYLKKKPQIECENKEKCKKGRDGQNAFICPKEKCELHFDIYLKELLLAEKVIFKNINDKKEKEYIIPSYLPLAKDDKDFELQKFGFAIPNFTLKFLWFIPFGLINQLICYFGNLPDIKRYWRDNVIFTFLGKFKVWIELNFEQLSISIYIVEDTNDKKDDNAEYHKRVKDDIKQYLDTIKNKVAPDTKLEKELGEYNKTLRRDDTQESDVKISLQEVERFIFYKIWELYWSLRENDDQFPELKKEGQTKIPNENFYNFINYLPYDMYLSIDNEWFVKYETIHNLEKSQLTEITTNFEKSKKTGEYEQKEMRLSDFRNYTFNKNIMGKKKIFISYSRKDVDFKDTLNLYLQILEQLDIAVVWNCEKIDMSLDWDSQIKQQLDESNMIIYLLSPNFFSSYYVLTKEIFEKEDIADKKILLVKVGEYTDLGKLKELVPDARKNNLIGRLSNLETYKMLPYGRIENKVTGQSEEKIIPLDQYRFFCGSINPAMKQIVDLIIDTIH